MSISTNFLTLVMQMLFGINPIDGFSSPSIRFSVTGAERFSVCRRAKHVHSTCLCKSLMILMRLMFFHTDHRQKGTWYVLQFKMHPDLLCLLQAFRTKTCLDYQQLSSPTGHYYH
ncbi:uncharacterized protein LOC113287262 isoform X3 [Papaver somniferum]|uniref:uncharacterized protein LOC113287262 isoform X3 n=1 Tax=Papaver somniferum TaxID=3469 RepID=UPI000E7011F4|nr:uncharacterized protein LOC113287262 isoform X3 [Papaver somniferum]